MKTLSINNRKILVVEVPEGISDFEIENDRLYCYPDGDILSQHGKYIPLPPGSWKILAKALEITEEQAKEIVESQVWEWGETAYPDGTIDYSTRGLKTTWHRDYRTENHWNAFSALDSFRSLCAKEQINPEHLLLIEQI